jgi:hypothetical protein
MADNVSDCVMNSPDETYLKSVFYEQLVEHVFVSEVLQEVWFSFGKTAEVLRSEIDAFGYDLVLDCNGRERHVQLKTSKHDAKASVQKVNIALGDKPYGCVVWIFRDEEQDTRRMKFKYGFFECGKDTKPPKWLENSFKVAKHSKGNSQGEKTERKAIRVVPKSAFDEIPDIHELVKTLCGL